MIKDILIKYGHNPEVTYDYPKILRGNSEYYFCKDCGNYFSNWIYGESSIILYIKNNSVHVYYSNLISYHISCAEMVIKEII